MSDEEAKQEGDVPGGVRPVAHPFPVPGHIRTHQRLPRAISFTFIALWLLTMMMAFPILKALDAERSRQRQPPIDLERFQNIPGLTLISGVDDVNR